MLILTVKSLEEIYKNSFSRKYTLNEIKEIHKIFFVFNSFKEFSNYLKSIADLAQLIINKKEDKLIIYFQVEYPLKKENVEIILTQEKINLENIVINLCNEIESIKKKLKILENDIKGYKNIEEKMKILENENLIIKKQMNEINKKFFELNINKAIKNSAIIENANEFNIIISAIKSRINKEIKDFKKIYQASIDGGNVIDFHSKCDNIPNTLTVIKSKGNRRFGGFTTQTWDSSDKWKDDKNAFLFSLDKQKIYKYKNDGNAIRCCKDYILAFGHACDIFIHSEKKISTGESYFATYEYNGDKNALAEDGKCNYISAEGYEMFEIIFE